MVELPCIYGLDGDTIDDALAKRNTSDLRKTFIENLLSDVRVSLTSSDEIYENAVALIQAHGGRIRVGEFFWKSAIIKPPLVSSQLLIFLLGVRSFR